MVDGKNTRSVNAREAVEQIRGPLTNARIMEKFKISSAGFADLLKQLFQKRLINEEDLEKRGIKFRIIKQISVVEEPVGTLSPSLQQSSEFEEDDQFLDTVTLTHMFTSKEPNTAPKVSESEHAGEKELNQK